MEKDFEEILKSFLGLLEIKEKGWIYEKKKAYQVIQKLQNVNQYLNDPEIHHYISKLIEYEGSGWLARATYPYKELAERISDKVKEIEKTCEKIVLAKKPELKPDEKILVLQYLTDYAKIKMEIEEMIKQPKYSEKKISLLRSSLRQKIEGIKDVLPWVEILPEYRKLNEYYSYYEYTKPEEEVAVITSLIEKIKREIRLPEEELKEFIKNLYNIEAETRIKTQEKMIEDLNKIINKKEIENKKLKEKVENLEKKGKALKEDLGKKEKEIRRKEDQLEELGRKLEKEIEINRELNEEVKKLKEERAKILLQQLPIDTKFEIEKEIENLRKSIQEKERYISSLEAARKEEKEILKANINNLEKQLEEKVRIIKEKEKEIENLRKEEIKVYERLTKEDLDMLEEQLKELSYAKDKGESLTALKTIGDKILKIYKKIYFFLDENGLTTEVEDNLLRDLWSLTKDYLKPESKQADEIVKQKITEIIAQCEYFKNTIQTNKEIEKMLSHL